MTKRLTALLAGIVALATSAPAVAYDHSAEVKVTVTYMPTNLIFQVNQTIGTCAAGTMLTWTPQGSAQDLKDKNAAAVLASLMTAKATGGAVRQRRTALHTMHFGSGG
ncbi:hypothetical protein A0J57_17645 [Sphingobium sp. 22B]|uniref:hypothetical protein n=1 Tax=unclassified Sphingobium TaxID=2611147 RepID=UPI0007857CF1|nr:MULTISPECIES: hypothetical protein [unclassified Sphingobium]KXU31117.1 hypothetical protein AXW74_13910 [Sphingobium sp. AM]KYC30970.1 hypothetical protein A0J57_17645 [Sphingobium sp. 22B]OAP30502.1 hypothetical protein A8O16_17930 [Sphingobium sp. 20006FA]